MSFKPQRAGSRKGIYSRLPPPRSFISAAMDLAMVHAAKRHSELIAGFASQRARLRVAQMVGVGRLATTDQAGLPGDVT